MEILKITSPAPVALSHALPTAARLLKSLPLVCVRALTKTLFLSIKSSALAADNRTAADGD